MKFNKITWTGNKSKKWLAIMGWVVFLLVGCHTTNEQTGQHGQMLRLPELNPIDLPEGKLRVVTTTSIIGDVVAHVGGEDILLTTLMGPGQDSHSYEPSARDLTAVAEAHVVFVNGWDLEESLLDNLTTIAENIPIIPVSANIEPLALAEEDHEEGETHEHEGTDPHVWLDPHHALQWVDNVVTVFSTLDPANSAVFQQNATTYKTELNELIAYYDEQIATLPTERRELVTNHDALGYFAVRYNFQLIGTVIPSISTLAEPSASGLAELVEAMKTADVCTLFAETSANDELAQAAATELNSCATVQVLTLYTESIGEPGSGTDSYIGMMQANIDSIVTGLK